MKINSINFDNSFHDNLPGLYQQGSPDKVANPRLVYWNDTLEDSLGFKLGDLSSEQKAELFSGNTVIDGAQPLAQAYAGHQFGQFNPQLGDGRALILGEVLDVDNTRLDICLKGSGRTAYSRGGDGKAALGPMLREVLIGQAMYALGIPTTQSLAVVATGELVYREQALPGAVLTRTAASHLRIGTFEYYAARRDTEKLKQLADYTIARHFPDVESTENPYLGLVSSVIARQAQLIAQWMSVGFIHGVMNTDNMTISGETIDYGPCAFMEAYKPTAVFSSIDRRGRYAYLNQPGIGQWNLTRFAEALLPLIDPDPEEAVALVTQSLNDYSQLYQFCWYELMREKLGLQAVNGEEGGIDTQLIDDWLSLLEMQQVDFTLAWRYLADAVTGHSEKLASLFSDTVALESWLTQWRAESKLYALFSDADHRSREMKKINPYIIPRNHHVEAALTAASETNDLLPFMTLLKALESPFEESATNQTFSQPADTQFTEAYKTFCGT